MEENDLKIIKKFAKHCSQKAREHFGRTDISLTEFVEFLVEKKMVDPCTLRNYMIVTEYPEVYRQNNYHHGYTRMDLGIEYNISEHRVKQIINGRQYDHLKKDIS